MTRDYDLEILFQKERIACLEGAMAMEKGEAQLVELLTEIIIARVRIRELKRLRHGASK
jgi:hypothetical protein